MMKPTQLCDEPQIEIIVFRRNNLYNIEVFSALDETNALRQSTY